MPRWRGQKKFSKREPLKWWKTKWLKFFLHRKNRAIERKLIDINDPLRADELSKNYKKEEDPWGWD